MHCADGKARRKMLGRVAATHRYCHAEGPLTAEQATDLTLKATVCTTVEGAREASSLLKKLAADKGLTEETVTEAIKAEVIAIVYKFTNRNMVRTLTLTT